MATASNFLIAVNDEHGLNPPTVGKRTPIMPYLNRSFYENEVNRECKLRLLASLSRCGFNVYDVKSEIVDVPVSERVRRVNRVGSDALITFGYNAYGNGATFNNIRGFCVFYSNESRYPSNSRLLSLDVSEGLASLLDGRNLFTAPLSDVGVLESVSCPSCLVESGFMTNFNEAKQMLNPIFCEKVAEGTCTGVCDYFNVPYVAINAPKRTLRRGNRGSEVKYLQYLLILGGYKVSADGVFGLNTQNAVLAFQKDVGITEDGVVGRVTWDYLTRNLTTYPTLRRGSRGAYVVVLQSLLTTFLYPLGSVDGIFGANTERAVKEFQQENSLAVDGIVGVNTWRALVSSNGRPMPNT